MSGPLAIAAVTAVLKKMLDNGFINHDLSTVGSFSVTALPPDRITTGTQEPNQLNLFLYQVTPNQGWRNVGLPSRDSGSERLTNPPLALDLHYLMTAYGSQDFNAEILFGYAMQILHETPVVTRKDIRAALGSPSPAGGSSSPFGNLSALDLADQVEQIKITPHYLATEELSKLWTAMQARYRQSMAYQVSVVLIQSTKPVKTALPVINRGKDDRGVEALADARSTFPSLESIHIGPIGDTKLDPLPRSYPSAELGLQLILQGQNLDGDTVQVHFKHTRFAQPEHPQYLEPINIQVTNPTDRAATQIKVILPPIPPIPPIPPTPPTPVIPAAPVKEKKWLTGLYTVSVAVTKDAKVYNSNELPLVITPKITAIAPSNSIARAGGDVSITITCEPKVIKEQSVTLLLADREITANPRTGDADTLVFVVKDAPVVADAPIRLRVDGTDSMPFERLFDGNGNPKPLAFAENKKVTIT